MTELFNDIPQWRKDLIVIDIANIPGNDGVIAAKNLSEYVSSLTPRERDFANFYIQLIFERVKGVQDESNFN